MNENNELLEYIYQDSEMAKYSIERLINELKGKDNKIIKTLEDILKKYEEYYKSIKKQLKGVKAKPIGMMAKMGSSLGIKKEVISDNSDASIADMLIKGISMGTLDMEKKISQYDEIADKKTIKMAKEFLEFQNETINSLKKYL